MGLCIPSDLVRERLEALSEVISEHIALALAGVEGDEGRTDWEVEAGDRLFQISFFVVNHDAERAVIGGGKEQFVDGIELDIQADVAAGKRHAEAGLFSQVVKLDHR